MAKDYAYSSELMKRVRKVIQNFGNVLAASRASHDEYLEYLDIHQRDDADQVRQLYFRYRDHLAKGVVYLLAFKNTLETTPRKLLIKIGYSSDLSRRKASYADCNIYHQVLLQFP
ncbi:hypothetical protein BGZ82_006404 [Podila clonocystis]|nr:hypothetical protein BGZ82_006404 [Podila clonocystis]